MNDNLLDFTKWNRFDTGNFSGAIDAIAFFENRIFAAIDGQGVFSKQNGIFVLESFLSGSSFKTLESSADKLFITTDHDLYTLSVSGQLQQVVNDKIISPLMAIADGDGFIWIADASNGMVSNYGGEFQSYVPNGPSINQIKKLDHVKNTIIGLQGGFSLTGEPLENAGLINTLESGVWSSEVVTLNDLTKAELSGNKTFISSFGNGLLQTDQSGNATVLDESNSPLEKITLSKPGVFVTSMVNSPDGLWITNFGASKSLHLLKPDNTWKSFSPASTAARYTDNIVIDQFSNVWMIVNASVGGGVVFFDPIENKTLLLTETVGNGELPDRTVRSIAVDRDGYIWVGTNKGVAYFYNENSDAVKPIFENRFLLKDEKITAIAVDGGNRKWMGTERGVWLFNATGEVLVHNFTMENSPLLSDIIYDIEINPTTGEVFFATDKGVASFRSDATTTHETSEQIKIFPNPVTANFSGQVGITGVATDAVVKITDVSGKLVWQTQANGGTATWNVRDYNGRRAATGVYLVFASSADGTSGAVGKITVID